mmetsp:Transcript_1893/g.2156  ORF Transcript_1893/g.2156 Transcript_1893/m.2156 type:complete len:99 (+) Transcript_1893:72-368(+)
MKMTWKKIEEEQPTSSPSSTPSPSPITIFRHGTERSEVSSFIHRRVLDRTAPHRTLSFDSIHLFHFEMELLWLWLSLWQSDSNGWIGFYFFTTYQTIL